MRWWVHDGDTVVEIATDSRPPEGDARRLEDRELESVLMRVANDLWGISTLRRIYVDAVARGGSASVSDFVVVGEVIEAALGGRFVAWASEPVRERLEAKPQTREATPLADLTDLVSHAVAPAPATSPAILSQIAILTRASAAGVPFCEECECDEPE